MHAHSQSSGAAIKRLVRHGGGNVRPARTGDASRTSFSLLQSLLRRRKTTLRSQSFAANRLQPVGPLKTAFWSKPPSSDTCRIVLRRRLEIWVRSVGIGGPLSAIGDESNSAEKVRIKKRGGNRARG